VLVEQAKAELAAAQAKKEADVKEEERLKAEEWQRQFNEFLSN